MLQRCVFISDYNVNQNPRVCFCHADMGHGWHKLAWQARLYHLLLTPATSLGYSHLAVMGWVTTVTKKKKSQVGPRPKFIKLHLLKLWVTTLGLNAGVMKIWRRVKGNQKLIHNQNCVNLRCFWQQLPAPRPCWIYHSRLGSEHTAHALCVAFVVWYSECCLLTSAQIKGHRLLWAPCV